MIESARQENADLIGIDICAVWRRYYVIFHYRYAGIGSDQEEI